MEKQKLFDKYSGVISKEEGKKLDKHIEDSRNVWDIDLNKDKE